MDEAPETSGEDKKPVQRKSRVRKASTARRASKARRLSVKRKSSVARGGLRKVSKARRLSVKRKSSVARGGLRKVSKAQKKSGESDDSISGAGAGILDDRALEHLQMLADDAVLKKDEAKKKQPRRKSVTKRRGSRMRRKSKAKKAVQEAKEGREKEEGVEEEGGREKEEGVAQEEEEEEEPIETVPEVRALPPAHDVESVTAEEERTAIEHRKSEELLNDEELRALGLKEAALEERRLRNIEERREQELVVKVMSEVAVESRRLSDIVDEEEEPEPEPPGRGVVLMEKINEDEIDIIYEAFKKTPTGAFNQSMFRNVLKEVAHIRMSDEEFDRLFLKMDTTRDSLVTWDEFISHLMLEYQEMEMMATEEELHLPLEGSPTVVRSDHRHPVCRVGFWPIMSQDRTFSYLTGKYVTASKDGMIHYWSTDFELEHTAMSECPNLKVQPTWVTDMACMPDVDIICTSTVERELRFYDVTAKNFDLRVIVTSMENAVMCMDYHFYKSLEQNSCLVLGDTGGNVRILLFNSKSKGPFINRPEIHTTHVRYEELAKGALKEMKVVEMRNIHTAWVRQVAYYCNLKSFLSCAACPENSMFLCDIWGTKSKYGFNVPLGVNCFNFDEDYRVIVTGSQDCKVRAWNAFVPSKPSAIFEGHKTAIVAIVLQNNGNRIFSISKDRMVKVWDLPEQICLQTYFGISNDIGERSPLAVYYNPTNRNLVVASIKICFIILTRKLNEERTDGITHTMSVTKALYNSLFKCIVTVGLDSVIMVWDPWTGKRMFMLKNAHTRPVYGELRPVEITAATFDPSWQLLLTGARDGSLKVWNFNTGTCLRSMNIEENCEVTNVVWIPLRILAVGWNRHVTEWADQGDLMFGKKWETRHTEDVLSTAYRADQALATSSYNGELILWRLETGQAYRRYHVSNPNQRILLTYNKETAGAGRRKRSSLGSGGPFRGRRVSKDAMTISTALKKSEEMSMLSTSAFSSKLRAEKTARRVSVVQVPVAGATLRPLTVHAMLFLSTRPMKINVGTLFVAVNDGNIQVWSHHIVGGFLQQFFAIHMAGDYVVSMATDPGNEYLFTGTTMGYIKIWLMKNYALPDAENIKICLSIYRLQFPFLWRDRVEGRAKRSLREQKWPLLLSSYRAHLEAVNNVEYLPDCKIVLTCSLDTTVRLWSLAGRYLATLGTFHPWPPLKPDVEPVNLKFRIPPDIIRVGSSTTMKVMKGGNVPRTHFKFVDDSDQLKELPMRLINKVVYGHRLTRPFLGHYFKITDHMPSVLIPKLDTTMPFIPVYCHLNTPSVEDIKRPPTPPEIVKMRVAKPQQGPPIVKTMSPILKNTKIISNKNNNTQRKMSKKSIVKMS